MSDLRSRGGIRTALGALAAFTLACAGLGLFAWRVPGAEAAELARAEARWATRPFSAYHLTLRDKSCIQQIEVSGERIVRTQPNRCEPPPRAVTDLFTLIRRDGTVSARCIALGCACDDVMSIEATYHPSLGYPEQIVVRVNAQPNWQHLDFWAYLAERRAVPHCNLAEGSKLIRILALTPIP